MIKDIQYFKVCCPVCLHTGIGIQVTGGPIHATGYSSARVALAFSSELPGSDKMELATEHLCQWAGCPELDP